MFSPATQLYVNVGYFLYIEGGGWGGGEGESELIYTLLYQFLQRYVQYRKCTSLTTRSPFNRQTPFVRKHSSTQRPLSSS